MDEHPEKTANWDIAWDARGNLIEPHTRKTIPLSTLAVRKYVQEKGWLNKYGAVLFCEKEGFPAAVRGGEARRALRPRDHVDQRDQRHRRAHPDRRTDQRRRSRSTASAISILSASTSPARSPATRAAMPGTARAPSTSGCGSRMSKPAGWRASGSITRTASGYSPPRTQIRAKIVEPLRADGATEEEITFLETHRVELNAFTSGDLVKWIEGKLDEHGVKKVVPDDATLAEEARSEARDVVIERILDEMSQGDRRGSRRVRDRRLLLGDQDPGSLCRRSNLAMERGAGGHRARRCLAQRTAAMSSLSERPAGPRAPTPNTQADNGLPDPQLDLW